MIRYRCFSRLTPIILLIRSITQVLLSFCILGASLSCVWSCHLKSVRPSRRLCLWAGFVFFLGGLRNWILKPSVGFLKIYLALNRSFLLAVLRFFTVAYYLDLILNSIQNWGRLFPKYIILITGALSFLCIKKWVLFNNTISRRDVFSESSWNYFLDQ